jgi:zinc transport system substrate-binding protein
MRYTISLIGVCLTLPAFAEVPNVVTDIPAVHSLAAMVMGDLGQPTRLLNQGADPHNFQLRPSQTQALSGSDVVFWVGPELTPWMERALDSFGDGMNAVALLNTAGEHDDDHVPAADDGHDDHDDGHDDGHGNHGIDPHAWLNSDTAAEWVEVIAAELARIDPANAAQYMANAAVGRAEITALSDELSITLAPASGVDLVMFHDAYDHFADQFGLTIVGTIALGDAATPGAARLSDLRATLAQHPDACVFPEITQDVRYVTLIVEGSDTLVGTPLDPLGSFATPGPALYGTLMRDMANAIADCAALALSRR